MDGTYAPLSRPLFIYVNTAALARPEVREFIRFYLANAGGLAEELGNVAIPPQIAETDAAALESAIAGS
jgi:phosphate transport system substrate-binding protein